MTISHRRISHSGIFLSTGMDMFLLAYDSGQALVVGGLQACEGACREEA